jgi:hypothetical protein
MEKFSLMLKNWKTSVMSVAPILASVAIAFGWIDLEQQTAIINGIETVFTSADSVLNEIMGTITAVTGIGLLFSKDADKSSKKLGLD